MSFVGGKLKLKGVGELKVKGGVKKKKKCEEEEPKEKADAKAVTTADLNGYQINPEEQKNTMTESERRREEKMKKMDEDRIKKLAGKSYREHVKDFNEYLGRLSEHHDIPKVGPG